MKLALIVSLVILSGCAELSNNPHYSNGTVRNIDQEKFDRCMAKPEVISRCLRNVKFEG